MQIQNEFIMLVPKHTYTHTHMYMRNKLTFAKEKKVNNFKEDQKNWFRVLNCVRLCKKKKKKTNREKKELAA